jgi:hypothetical protein
MNSYVTSDALHGSMAAGHGVALVVQGQEGGLCMEKHTDGFRPMKTELFPRVYAVRCAYHTAWLSSAQCCDVL